MQPVWLGMIGATGISLSSVVADLGTLGELATMGAEFLGPALLIAAPILFLEAVNPQMIEQAESEGNFNTGEWFKQSFMDKWKDIGQFILFQNGKWADVLNEQNAYIKRINQPLYEQRDQRWQKWGEICDVLWKSDN